MQLLERLRRHAGSLADEPALIGDGGTVLSYAELLGRVLHYRAALEPYAGETIALYAPSSPAWACFDIAALEAMLTTVPLPLFFSAEQLRHTVASAGITLAAVTDPDRFCLHFPEACPIDARDPFTILRLSAARQPHPGIAKITFTSGTTGTPKGVCLSAALLLSVAQSLADTVALRPGDRHLCVLPLSILLENIGGVYAPLLGGAVAVLPEGEAPCWSDSTSVAPERLLDAMRRHAITTAIATPEILKAMMRCLRADRGALPATLRFLAVGSSFTSPHAITEAHSMGLPVYEGYGLSEAGSVVSLNTPRAQRIGSVGRILPHVEARIREGEIQIRGMVLSGYLGQPHHTGEWFSTGDCGRIDADGFLYITGRRRNVLITSYGRNVSPEWIESELTAAGIGAAVVYGDSKPWLTAVLFSGAQDAVIELMLETINARLPDYARIRGWVRGNGSACVPGTGREAILSTYRSELEKLYTLAAHYNDEQSGTLCMNFYERLELETKNEQEELLSQPFIKAGLQGTLSLESYLAFLTQAYHHVRHTAPLMMGAGLRFTGRYEPLRKAMSEYIEEEIGHDEWILNDITACGGDAAAVRNAEPALPIELMVSFTYDVVNRRNPLGIFGMVFVLEGTSIKAATPAAEALQQGLGLPKQAFTYLTTHGSLDMEHFEFFKGLMNNITDRDEQDWIIHCAKVIFRLYTDMFRMLPLRSNARTEGPHAQGSCRQEGVACA